MQHYDILIATPGSSLQAGYVKSLTETLAECQRRGITYKWLNGQASLVHFAREFTITGDNNINGDDVGPMHDKVTYNKIFCIDSDIEWSVEQFFKLYESKYEVSTGAYILGDNRTTSIHAWGKVGGIAKREILRMKEPVKIQSMGLGFTCIKSGVFERLERPWFTHFAQPMRSNKGKNMNLLLGEDISFCVKLYEAKIDIWFYPNVLVNHLKTHSITW